MLPSVSVIKLYSITFSKPKIIKVAKCSLSDMDGAEKKMLEDEILLLLQTSPQGVGDDVLIKRLPGVTAGLRAQAINQLLKEAKIDLFKSKEGLLYKAKAPSKAASIAGDQEEKIVYSIVEKAGNFGSWIRDIRSQSNLGQTQLNKVLKSLESKKLIKSVKTVNATKKKVYMLYNLEPDHSVTGGAWYNEQDFDSEFVEILNQQCYRYVSCQISQLNLFLVVLDLKTLS